MKASEARLIAENKKRSDFRESFDKVMQRISIECKNGYFEFLYFDRFPIDVENAIKELGYIVEKIDDGRNGIDIKISW